MANQFSRQHCPGHNGSYMLNYCVSYDFIYNSLYRADIMWKISRVIYVRCTFQHTLFLSDLAEPRTCQNVARSPYHREAELKNSYNSEVFLLKNKPITTLLTMEIGSTIYAHCNFLTNIQVIYNLFSCSFLTSASKSDFCMKIQAVHI